MYVYLAPDIHASRAPPVSVASCLALVQDIGQAWCTYGNRTMMSPCSPMCTQLLENHSIQSHMLIEERQTSQMSQPNLSLSTGETAAGKERYGPHPGPPTPPDALPDGLSSPQVPLGCHGMCLGVKGSNSPGRVAAPSVTPPSLSPLWWGMFPDAQGCRRPSAPPGLGWD